MQDTKGIKSKKKLEKELQNIRSNFVKNGTTLEGFCKQNGIDKPNVYKIFRGKWNGEKAQQLKKRLIDASKGKTEFLTTVEK